MLTYKHFHDLSEHISIAWRGFFPEWEIDAMSANDYAEYRRMVRDATYISEDMVSLADSLREDIENGVTLALEVDTYNAIMALMEGRRKA